RGYDVVKRVYEAIKAGDRVGAMAEKIVQNAKNIELKKWYSTLTPEALGSLLATMLSAPKAFTVIEGGKEKGYDAQAAHLFQQHAIETILTSIYENAISENSTYEGLAAAQERFGKAVLRFVSFKNPDNPSYDYNKNLYRMNNFMAANAGEETEDRLMQKRYVNARNRLGGLTAADWDHGTVTQFMSPEADSELTPWKKY
ncbi:MAG: xlyA, partial [Pseudomonas sp.]|nr:xlyA [Pseudomonas sp.]